MEIIRALDPPSGLVTLPGYGPAAIPFDVRASSPCMCILYSPVVTPVLAIYIVDRPIGPGSEIREKRIRALEGLASRESCDMLLPGADERH